MKFKNYLMLFSILTLGACKQEVEVATPDFGVKASASSFAVGEEVKFDLTGSPGIITFYSGELFNDYEFKDGRIVEPGKLILSFNSAIFFGTQKDQLSVWVSTDFNNDYSDISNVHNATWVDITNKVALATKDTFKPSGEVDISNLVEDNKPLYIGFKYLLRDKNVYGVGRQWRINNFLVTAETSIGIVTLTDYLSSGFQVVDLNPRGVAPTNSLYNPATFLRMAPFPATPENADVVETEVWGITRALYPGTMDLGPDRPIAIKGNEDAQQSIYIYPGYSKPGVYKAYFVAKNANIYDSKEVVREVTVTITP